MICVALGHCSLDDCLVAIASEECVELRFDLLPGECSTGVSSLCGGPAQVVATFRAKKAVPDHVRREMLLRSIAAGATYVDVDGGDSDVDIRGDIISAARSSGVKVIVSYHNFQVTPGEEALKRLRDDAFSLGADIFKVACAVAHSRDNATLLGLLSDHRPQIVIGMGDLGRLTRVVAPLLGSVMTYAAPNHAPGTAPGQLTAFELRSLQQSVLSRLGGPVFHE